MAGKNVGVRAKKRESYFWILGKVSFVLVKFSRADSFESVNILFENREKISHDWFLGASVGCLLIDWSIKCVIECVIDWLIDWGSVGFKELSLNFFLWSRFLMTSPSAVELQMQKSMFGCSVFMGPACTGAIEQIRGLLSHWNVPVLTTEASGITGDQKTASKLMTRLGFTQSAVQVFVAKILDNFHWTSVAVVRICTVDLIFSKCSSFYSETGNS